MLKKFITPLLAAAVCLQLVLPFAAVLYKERQEKNIIEKGTVYTVGTVINSVNGENVYILTDFKIDIAAEEGYANKYAVISRGENEDAGISEVKSTRPAKGDYIFLSQDNLKELGTYKADADMGTVITFNTYGTAKIKVYKGDIRVEQIYISGTPIEEWGITDEADGE